MDRNVEIVQIRTLVSISVAVPDFEIAHVERCAALCVLQSEVDAETDARNFIFSDDSGCIA